MTCVSRRPRADNRIIMGHCTFLLSYDEYQYLLLLTTISTVQVPILETVAQLLRANFNINVSAP